MGMLNLSALTTIVATEKHLLIDIPEEWSMEDGATVPVAYGVALYAFFTVSCR